MIPRRAHEVVELAASLGLDFFDLKFEVVPWEVMHEIASYGLPIRAHHWSYGRAYRRLEVHGRMGLSKIYEIVLNNDPAYAFLLDTNTEVENLLIVAHVAAHSDFFKHNVCFTRTQRNMVAEAAEHAARVERYRERYGERRVERLMDAAFALERHIDPHKGVHREPYPKPQVVEEEVPERPYADLFPGEEQRSIRRVVKGDKLPPHPESDLLWFLSQYAPLEPWERDVLDIVREEAHYFYPQFNTKVLNEGWASYWHAEVIHKYDNLSPKEMIDFSALHASVVRPGGPLHVNPYYLGYKILVDVERRWNEKFKAGESKVDGRAKLFEIRSLEDDFSFLRNYLTPELIEEMELYTYAPACDCGAGGRGGACARCGEIAVESREPEAVVEALLRPRYNYGVPKVVVAEVRTGRLFLEHVDTGLGGLDREYAEKTLELVREIWKGPVSVRTIDRTGRPIEIALPG